MTPVSGSDFFITEAQRHGELLGRYTPQSDIAALVGPNKNLNGNLHSLRPSFLQPSVTPCLRGKRIT
jgi:hypothetical protein